MTKLSKESYIEYLKLRKCASSLYQNQLNLRSYHYSNQFTHSEDHQRSEEDMADIISFKTFQNEPTLYSCTLLTPQIDGTIYQPLKLYAVESKLNSHSETLLRILREAIHKKIKLPKSCKKLIDKNVKDFRFEPCF